MAHPVETAELFDIDVDHLTGAIAFVPANRRGRLQVAPPVEAVAGEYPSDGSPGNADLGGDPVMDAPFLAKGLGPVGLAFSSAAISSRWACSPTPPP